MMKDTSEDVIEDARRRVFEESESLEDTCTKVKGYDFNNGVNHSEVINFMGSTGFQASHLGDAIHIVNHMLDWRLSHEKVAEDCSEEEKNPTYRESVKCKIFLGFTSNLISSGLRDIIRYLAQHHMVEVIVTEAGGIEEDLIKCLADTYRGEFSLPGAALRSKGLNRIGNLLVPDDNYCKFRDWINPILDHMFEEQKTKNVLWTPSKVIALLGKEINAESSYLYWAYKNDIPVFCPGLTDGFLGKAIYDHFSRNPGLVIDIVQDIRAINGVAVHANTRKTGMIILGGLPKHHICNANMMLNGADYAVFINTAQEFDGSDSGARPDEAVSWGRIRSSAESVKVHCDATIAFPLLVAKTFAAKREKPSEPVVRKPAEPRSDVIDNVRSVVCPKIKGYDFNNGVNYSELLKSMASTGFQASNLCDAIDTVNEMLDWRLSHEQVAQDCSEEENNPAYRESVNCKIFLGFSSNLISSGVRDTIRYLVQHRMVDAIVTTTGGIEEDLIKCLADTYRDELSLPDVALRLKGLNRIYNLLVPNSNYCKFQDWVIPIFDQMFEEQKTKNVLWTPSKVIARLGKEINYESSYLYWAYKNDIPVFCPALTDGSLGDLLYYHLFRNPGLVVDIVQDYAVFINTAQEFDGSDSGASPDEAVSWGKIRASAKSVKVHSEAVKETEVTAKARSMMFKESQSLEGTCAQIQGYHSMIGTSDLGDSIETVNQVLSHRLFRSP
ncbi:deoxyhypusine synthase [Tanacetum coccineum]